MKKSKIKKINITISFGDSQVTYKIDKNSPYIIIDKDKIITGILGQEKIDEETQNEFEKIEKHWKKIIKKLNKKR